MAIVLRAECHQREQSKRHRNRSFRLDSRFFDAHNGGIVLAGTPFLIS
jgi:hypothetical protein